MPPGPKPARRPAVLVEAASAEALRLAASADAERQQRGRQLAWLWHFASPTPQLPSFQARRRWLLQLWPRPSATPALSSGSGRSQAAAADARVRKLLRCRKQPLFWPWSTMWECSASSPPPCSSPLATTRRHARLLPNGVGCCGCAADWEPMWPLVVHLHARAFR